MASMRSLETGEQQASRFSRFLRSPQRYWQFHGGPIFQLGRQLSYGVGKIRGSYLWQRAITARARERDTGGSDHFLIVSAPRSGTTMMVDYLNCHPRVQCRGEILNPDYGCYGNPVGMDKPRLELHVKSFFVKRAGVMLGAKILTNQLDESSIGLEDLIDFLDQPRIIVLYREQLLEQYASLKLAEHTGVWHSNKAARSEPIWLDPCEFVQFAARERWMWRENMAALVGIDAHFLSYEQLTNDARGAMRDVFAFLGLKRCPVNSFVAKLHDKPLSEKLANYQDFVKTGIAAGAVLSLPFSEELKRAKAG
jgi:LPS sulfotransferase NodH